MAQNDPHVALIILTTHVWGEIFLVEEAFRSKICDPAQKPISGPPPPQLLQRASAPPPLQSNVQVALKKTRYGTNNLWKGAKTRVPVFASIQNFALHARHSLIAPTPEHQHCMNSMKRPHHATNNLKISPQCAEGADPQTQGDLVT